MFDVVACIVTYRSDIGQLRRAIESFHAQNLNAHLTIIDNDSGDSYLQQLHAMDGVQVVSSGANQGFGYGHNIGIKDAPSCRYYLVMNPDVVLHDGCLKSMIDYMDGHSETGLLVPKMLNPDGSLQPLNKRLPSVFDFFARRFLPASIQRLSWVKKRLDYFTMQDVGYDAPVEVPFASGCFMLFRAEALAEVGGFDEEFFMYLEDCDIGRRVAKNWKVMYLPDAVITHHWTRGSHHSWRLTWVMIRSMIHYFNKWGWKWL